MSSLHKSQYDAPELEPNEGQRGLLCSNEILFSESLFVNFCYLNNVYGLKQDKVSLSCNNNFLAVSNLFW